MLNLSATTRKLQLITSAAQAIDVIASYVDLTTASGAVAPDTQVTAIATATTTDVVSAPASGVVRNVKTLVARNKGAAANTVTLRWTDGSTTIDLISVSLGVGELLQFNDSDGFEVLDATGAAKQTVTGPGQLVTTQVITAGTAITLSAKTTRIRYRLVAGGGAGGSSAGAASSGGFGSGGGAGSLAEGWSSVAPGASLTCAIGAGGAAGAAGNTAGGNGGTTTLTISGTTIAANGGTGGAGSGAAAATALTVAGGAGGAVSTNADVNAAGHPGGPSLRSSATIGFSGTGAASPFGAGGKGVIAQGNGNAGVGYGAGGSGGASVNSATNQQGGAGAAGVILIEEYA